MFMLFSSGLLAYQMLDVHVVFLADILEQFSAWNKRNQITGGPGTGVKLGIVDGNLVAHRQLVQARELFGGVQLFAMGMAVLVEPGPLVEPDGVHYQRVAFP